MDYNKIGEFITTLRKERNLTQAKLAEKLCVSEKTISKWENGRGIPDTDFLPKLSEMFGVSINEILNGEKLSGEKYIDKAEEKLLEQQKAKQDSDKRLLWAEIVLGSIVTIAFISMILVATYIIETTNTFTIPIILFVLGFVIFIVGCTFCLYIEQKAGYYICKHCEHKYVPKFAPILFAPHMCRTRYMKCPKCEKYSWNKKVIK
ncbi:MAG: helix-turn-helix transcriptional regulator [Clostridiales bacterium]|nr:helix-turn-helix transcriptional regulator [Clostridiales bacterium]